MKSVWTLDLVDLKRSMMKVHKHESSVGKTFFVPYLKDAKLHLNTLLAICKDCVWVIDVETGVRRRVSEKALNGVSQMPKLPNVANMPNLDLPELFKKSA